MDHQYTNTFKICLRFILAAISCLSISQLKAQLNPLSTQYYTNTYLANPAMAGKEAGLRSYAVFRSMFNDIPGVPVTQNITATYGFKRVGLGININAERAGLQRDVRALASFAYHLPLNAMGNKLHFGVSLGFMNQRLSVADINGNTSDVTIGQYNDRQTYFDGDFGAAYSGQKLMVEVAIPNLKSFLKRDALKLADVSTFYTAVSYRIGLGKGAQAELEPKLVYRGVSELNNVWDGGLRISFSERQLLFTGLYHSNRSATFGMEMNFKNKYHFGSMYTTPSGALSGLVTGGFEVNLGLILK